MGSAGARASRRKEHFPVFRMNSRKWKDSVERYFHKILIFNVYQFGTMYEILILPENLEC
jgi:hypothetical protein